MSDPVHVVLLNYNGWRDAIECLESVLRSDYDNPRVIVVDNASTDGSLARLEVWTRGEEPGPRATNEALDQLSWPRVPKPGWFLEVAMGLTVHNMEGDMWNGRLARWRDGSPRASVVSF